MSSDHLNATHNVSRDNDRFARRFRWWGFGWMIVMIGSVTVTDYIILHYKPAYLHDWRGPAIFLLSLAIMAIYGFSITRKHTDWPPPLLHSLGAWVSLYIVVLLLIFIDANFAWDLYAVFGLSLALFNGRRLLFLTGIVFISLCFFDGVLTWPFDVANLGGLMALAISIFGTVSIVMILQYLISERYERNLLLTELTQAHTELAEAHSKLAESAVQEQELAVLRERTRLAREMHDTLGHALVLVAVKLEAAQRLRERDPERSERELVATQEIVRSSMNELRASIANLRSPTLEHEPACHALRRCVREMAQRTGIHVTYDLHPDIEGLPEQVEETLWKVGQEAIANIEKHAQASNIILHISRQESSILMSIEDDGIGLSANFCQTTCNSPEGHYGLSGMKERVESLGGSICISSEPEKGTTVEAELPLVEPPVGA